MTTALPKGCKMSITKDFNNELWYETVSGDGTAVVGDAGASIICSASSGSRAYRRYYFVARAGEKITIKVWAKNNPAAGKTGYATLFLDTPISQLINKVEIRSDEARLYTLSITVPQKFVNPTKMAFGIGSYTSLDGSAEFWRPEFYRSGSNIVMQGTIKFPSGGGAEIVPDFINNGIGNISYRSTDVGYRFEPSELFAFDESTGVNQFRPIVTISGGSEGNSVEPYIWYISKVNNVGWCLIQAVSLTTGAPVNLSTSTNQDRFVFFKMEMIS